MATRSQKRRDDGAHEPNLAERSRQRREDGARESRDQAARSQKRREDGAHENIELRDTRRKAKPAGGVEEIDLEIELRNLCYGSGVAFLPAGVGESDRQREQRHGRMRLLARRTGRAPNWRDNVSLGERASAIGVTLKEPSRGKEAAITRANKNL